MPFKTFLFGCFKSNNYKNQSYDPSLVPKKAPSRRFSLSDLSDISSMSIISDLSNSLLGSNLHVFTFKELQEITNNFSRSSVLGEGGFGKVYKGFIDDKLRPGLKPQVVAVKVLDLDGTQGHREWLVSTYIISNIPLLFFSN